MATKDEALKMAIDALEEAIDVEGWDFKEIVSICKEALEQQEQEPVVIGWRTDDYLLETTDKETALTWQAHFKVIPIFATHPAKQQEPVCDGCGMKYCECGERR